MKLYVGNVPFNASEQDFRNFFWPVLLAKVTICTDKESGRPRGFGFVEIDDPKEAEKCIGDLNDTDFGGRHAVVNAANEKPREKKYVSPRRGRLGRHGGRDRDGE